MDLALIPPQITGSDSGQVADNALGIWREIDASLAPVIGRRGVAALYQRSLHLVRREYPWLLAAHSAATRFGDFNELQQALDLQTCTESVAANTALLNAFYGLLISLIGESLTLRLLNE
jgi:hypothetical protein